MTVDVTDLNHHGNIVGIFPNVFNEELYCDVVFYCKGGRKVKSHRLLLGCVSSFLQSLFHEQKFRDLIEISLPDVNAEDLDIFLRFLYEGVIRLDAEEMDAFSSIKALLEINVPILQQSDSSEKILEGTVIRRKRKVDDSNNDPNPPKIRKCANPAHEERQRILSCFDQIIHNFKAKENTPSVPRVCETSVSQPSKTPLLVPLHQYQTAVKLYERKKLEKNLGDIVANFVKQEVEKIREEHREKKRRRKPHPPNQELNSASPPLDYSATSAATASKSTDSLCNNSDSPALPLVLREGTHVERSSISLNSHRSERGYNLFDSPLIAEFSPSPRIDVLKQKLKGRVLTSQDGTKTYHRDYKK
ncbi:Protein bric-a-brac 1 [Frankliniella fusca]|uniref:Protein bric-a-brac 1 n=1 Tax=Frankliniella fusca TaxID=407009 RepID=A0AAE1HIM0_9NEOP|nr:Protein bric-a-brac 1 [Frankliniella fusca]